MAKPAFDPKKPFEVVGQTQGQKPKFDPSKPFEPMDVSGEEPASLVGSVVRKGLAGATSGISDEAAGLTESAGRVVGLKGLGGPMKDITTESDGPSLDWEVLRDAYRRGRDRERQALAKDSKDNPGISTAAELVGAFLSPANKVAKGMSLVKGGALVGGITGLGMSESDSVGGVIRDTAASAVLGGTIGKVAEKASPYLSKAGDAVGAKLQKAKSAVGEKANEIAEILAFKSGGPDLKAFRASNARGMDRKIGRYMLDNDMVKPGDSVQSVAKKAEALNQKAGTALDEIYSKAGTLFKDKMSQVGFDPKRDRSEIIAAAKKELGDTVGAEAALNKLGKYLDEVAAGHGDGPMTKAVQEYERKVQEYLPKQRQFLKDRKAYREEMGAAADDLNQQLLPGSVDDLQRTGSSKTQVELRGRDPEIPFGENPLPDIPENQMSLFNLGKKDSELTAAQLMKRRAMAGKTKDALEPQAEIAGLELTPKSYGSGEVPSIGGNLGQTKMSFAPNAPARPVKPADIRNPMSPRRTNDIKGAIDNEINYSRNPLSKEPATEKAFYGARKKLLEKVDEGLEALGDGELATALKTANKEYGMSVQVKDMAQDRVNRINTNKMFGLTDTIAGAASVGYGGATGDWKGAVGIMALKKGFDKYGTAMIASAADKIGKKLLQQPAMQKLASESPKVFGATVYNLVQRLEERGSISLPKAADKNDAPKKGQEKWVDDGMKKLIEHGADSASIEKLRDSKTGKSLLIQASDLKPGTKAMDAIFKKMRTASAEGGN